MTENGLLEHIFGRLSHADSGEAIFGADEAAEWPDGALAALIKAGLLRPAQPAQVIECDGCERNCFMPVNVRPEVGGRHARAFIACDKPEDVGRVPVELRRLKQWRITGGLLAKTLARLLGITQAPQEDEAGKRWKLGMLKGKEHKGQVALAVQNGVSLKVAGHDIPIAEVLTLNNGKFEMDKDELLRFVDKPAMPPGAFAYKPSITRREARKILTQERYTAWRKSARELRRKPQGKSERWVSMQIEKTPVANGCSAETIRKHIRQ